jgi:hypothetical protein
MSRRSSYDYEWADEVIRRWTRPTLEPTTPTGIRMWESMTGGADALDGPFQASARHLRDEIAAIETEAREALAAELAALREALEIIAGPTEDAPEAVVVRARNIARAALHRLAASGLATREEPSDANS